ncbi:30S ribosomal protein S9 [Pseudonocardia sp. MH-G8]|nr:30S ribosomal protein S9 [Pseudonocardia sp. MH-G8]
MEAVEAVEEAAVDAEATEIADATDADADETADVTENADTDEVAESGETADAEYTDEYDAEVDADFGALPEVPSGYGDRPIQTVGRRKEAVVRVRLMPGSGAFRLNGKALEEYFPNKLHQQLIREPLVTVEKTERFDIFANLKGGGTSGQAGALRLAIARALIEADSEDRPPLKKAGFLTRDPRVIERKKYGLKKARKAPQYSKR